MDHGGVTIAGEDIGAGAFVQHEAEILGPHHRRDRHVAAPGNLARDLGRVAGRMIVVHRDRVAAAIVDLGRGPQRPGDAGHDGLDTLLDEILHLGVERPHRPFQRHALRDHVVAVAFGRDRADRDDHLFQRIDIAAGDGLQRDDNLGGDQNRIHAIMRFRGMAALAGHGDVELIRRRHHRAGPDRECADRDARHIVHPVDFLNGETLHQPVPDHLAPAAAAFLGGLEDHHGGAVEIPRLGQVFGGAQKHGGMAVMAAGMHLARHFRRIGQPGLFDDRQRVHVGAQADHPALAVAAPPDHADNAGAADPFHHLIAAEVAQKGGDLRGGAMHLEEKFRVFVEIAAPGGDFGLQLGKAVLDGHRLLLPAGPDQRSCKPYHA